MRWKPPLLSVLLLVAPEVALATADGPPDARCTCRSRDGVKHEFGHVVCMDIGDVRYLARCEMVPNVSSWQKLQDDCPVSAVRATTISVH
jgi:hypothetical protein